MLVRNAEIWFAKVNPKRPNNRFNKKNPSWECQLRTTSKKQKKEWEELGLNVKAMIPEEGPPYWRVNLRKKSLKANGEPSSFVKVVDGNLDDVDPDSIGNGSIANVRVFQYPYDREDGTKGLTSILMGLQLVKHIKYTPKPRDDDFTFTETEVIEEDQSDEDKNEEQEHSSPSPSPSPSSEKEDEDEDEEVY